MSCRQEGEEGRARLPVASHSSPGCFLCSTLDLRVPPAGCAGFQESKCVLSSVTCVSVLISTVFGALATGCWVVAVATGRSWAAQSSPICRQRNQGLI